MKLRSKDILEGFKVGSGPLPHWVEHFVSRREIEIENHPRTEILDPECAFGWWTLIVKDGDWLITDRDYIKVMALDEESFLKEYEVIQTGDI